VVRVSGRGSGRISVAGLACFKAGQPSRFSCRMQDRRLRPGTRRAMSEQDYASLITAAHRYMDAPVIVIWDNLNTHLSRKMRSFITGHPDWLTVIQLPACPPDTTGQLAAAMRHQLDRIQRRPSLITGFPGQTGLTPGSQPP